jgi:conjugative transfer pilus assembly protein TraH
MIIRFKRKKGLGNILILGVLFLILASSKAQASGIEKLMRYSEGALSNVSKPAVISDQQGGYMTGGSVIVRGVRAKSLQPLVVQTPKFAFDACTGSSDFRFGGLSYISAKEFTQFFKNTATAAGSYAVKMLIKSSCPQCEDIMSYLETVARDINGMMLEQCSLGQAIGGGLYNALANSNQQKCLMQGNIDKSNRDMFEASDKCKTNPERYGNKGEDNELKSLLGNEFNLVWKAISKGNGGDIDFKELIMSVSGTVIGRKIDGSFQFVSKPSLVLSRELLEEYIGVNRKNNKVKLYVCDNKDKCLEPSEKEVALNDKDTIYGNISSIIEKLIPKVQENKEQLTDEEKAIIEFSSIPLLQLIEMEMVQKANPADSLVRMEEFVQVVCYDVISNLLSQMLQQAITAVKTLEYAQLDKGVIDDFIKEANSVKAHLTSKKFEAFKRLQAITQVKERLEQQQRAFKASFAKILEFSN